jgi:putative addiction module antidote
VMARLLMRNYWPSGVLHNAYCGYEHALKLAKIGNSTGIILPRELLAKLRVELGDTIFVNDAPDGVRLTAGNPDFEAKMRTAEAIMRQDRDILRLLAR